MDEVGRVLAPGAPFYATFFRAPRPVHLDPIARRSPIVTHFDRNPYHQSAAELGALADFAGLTLELLGPWGDLHGQEMVVMTR